MAEVQSYERRPSLTSIPPSLAKWAVSREFRLSWQQRNTESLSMAMGVGLRPVTRDMLKKVNLTSGDNKVPLLSKLEQETACMWTEEGYLQRFDAILCYQPVGLFEENQTIDEEARRIQESGSVATDAVEEEINRAVAGTGVFTRGAVQRNRTNIPDAREGVAVHSKE